MAAQLQLWFISPARQHITHIQYNIKTHKHANMKYTR